MEISFFFPFFKFQNIIPYQSGVLRLVIIQALQFFFYIFESFAKKVKLKNKVNGSFSYVMSFERMGRQTESNVLVQGQGLSNGTIVNLCLAGFRDSTAAREDLHLAAEF